MDNEVSTMKSLDWAKRNCTFDELYALAKEIDAQRIQSQESEHKARNNCQIIVAEMQAKIWKAVDHSDFLEFQIANIVSYLEHQYPEIAPAVETACGSKEVLNKCAADRKARQDHSDG